MFIKVITELAAPLYRLLEKNERFIWNDNDDFIFEKLKRKWSKELKLILPDFNKRFILECDASDVGLGAVLRQEHGPIAYISRSLKKAEKSYSITEKEVLAAVWAMDKLTYFLGGKEFDIITDHKAMEQIKLKKDFGTAKDKKVVYEDGAV